MRGADSHGSIGVHTGLVHEVFYSFLLVLQRSGEGAEALQREAWPLVRRGLYSASLGDLRTDFLEGKWKFVMDKLEIRSKVPR